MNWLSVIQLAIKYGPIVKGILDMATSNEDVVSKIKATAAPLATVLEEVGAKMFPAAAPSLHIAAGALAAFDPDVTKWLQGELNVFVTPSPNLVVDGMYGPKTAAAVKLFQAAHGLAVDGMAGNITQSVIASLAAGKLVLK